MRGSPQHCLSAAFLAAALVSGPAFSQQPAAETRKRIIELFENARRAEQEQNLGRAVTLYSEIVKLDASVAEVWSNQGMALYRIDRDREAVISFEKAVALKPALLAPNLFGGLAYLKLGDPRKAIPRLETALKLDPSQSEAALGLAEAYTSSRQYERATRLCRRILERDPKSEEAGYRLASIYVEWSEAIGRMLKDSPTGYGKLLAAEVKALIQSGQAESQYREAVAAAPQSVEARLALGRYLLISSSAAPRLEAARHEFEKARQLNPRDLAVEVAFLRLAAANADFTSARSILRKIVHTDPSYARANLETLLAGLPDELVSEATELANKAVAQSGTGLDSYTARLETLERARRPQPLQAGERIDLAVAAWHLQRYAQALALLTGLPAADARAQYWLFLTCRALGGQALEQAVGTNPESGRSHLLLANFAVQKNDFDTARPHYEQAVALRPDDPEARLLFVRFLEEIKDYPQALKAAQDGVVRFSTHAGLNYHLGQLLLRDGEPESAIPCFIRSLTAEPKLTLARIGLADSYAATGKFHQAIHEITPVANSDTDGTLHYRLGRWYTETGRPREATEAFAITRSLMKATSRTLTESVARRSEALGHPKQD